MIFVFALQVEPFASGSHSWRTRVAVFSTAMPYKRRKYHHGDTHLRKKYKTKRRLKDLDEIDQDMQPTNSEKLLNQDVDYDMPGNAQFYCLHCARYFTDNHAMEEHFRSKVHKRRLKALEMEPYTQEEADAAAGMGSYVPAKKRKIETQPLKNVDAT